MIFKKWDVELWTESIWFSIGIGEFNRNWIQYVKRIHRNRLPRVKKHYFPPGRRNHDRTLRRFLDS
jgi:hypothetical protein